MGLARILGLLLVLEAIWLVASTLVVVGSEVAMSGFDGAPSNLAPVLAATLMAVAIGAVAFASGMDLLGTTMAVVPRRTGPLLAACIGNLALAGFFGSHLVGEGTRSGLIVFVFAATLVIFAMSVWVLTKARKRP